MHRHQRKLTEFRVSPCNISGELSSKTEYDTEVSGISESAIVDQLQRSSIVDAYVTSLAHFSTSVGLISRIVKCRVLAASLTPNLASNMTCVCVYRVVVPTHTLKVRANSTVSRNIRQRRFSSKCSR